MKCAWDWTWVTDQQTRHAPVIYDLCIPWSRGLAGFITQHHAYSHGAVRFLILCNHHHTNFHIYLPEFEQGFWNGSLMTGHTAFSGYVCDHHMKGRGSWLVCWSSTLWFHVSRITLPLSGTFDCGTPWRPLVVLWPKNVPTRYGIIIAGNICTLVPFAFKSLFSPLLLYVIKNKQVER